MKEDNLPRSLQMKAKYGYSVEQRPGPENLSDQGLFWYEVLLTRFKIENVNGLNIH